MSGDLIARFEWWQEQRTDLAERDATFTCPPTSGEWQGNDDEAVELLHETASALTDVAAMFTNIAEALCMEATRFTCTEAEAVATAWRHVNRRDADYFLTMHACGDSADEGDRHAPIYEGGDPRKPVGWSTETDDELHLVEGNGQHWLKYEHRFVRSSQPIRFNPDDPTIVEVHQDGKWETFADECDRNDPHWWEWLALEGQP